MSVGKPTSHNMKARQLDVKVALSLAAKSSLEFVYLSKDVFNRLFNEGSYPTYDVNNKFVSVTLIGSNILDKPTMYPITVNCELEENQIEIESLNLLQKYSSEFTVEDARIRVVEKVPLLNHIVISFPAEVYTILDHKPLCYIHKLLYEERESTSDFAIIKTGDISHTLNGTVIYSEPFDQGYINSSTSITIVKNSTNQEKRNDEIRISNLEIDDFEFDFDLNPLKVNNLSNSLIINNNRSQIPELVPFDVTPMEANTLEDFTQFSTYKTEFPFEDKSLYACLMFEDFKKLNCLSGDIVALKVANDDSSSPIFIRVFPFIGPCKFTSNSIYLSPLLIMALVYPTKIFIDTNNNYLNQRVDVPRHKLSKFIPLAKEVVLARVSTPITNDKNLQYLFLANLKSYFETAHRVISKGQLIPIAIDTVLGKSLHSTYGSKGWYPDKIPNGNPDSIAWFMVTNGSYKDPSSDQLVPIEPGKQYFVNSQKTRMLQSGIVKTNLNDIDFPAISRYLNIQPLFSYPNITLPGNKMTFQYAKTLRRIFDTFLKTKNKISLQTTILLTSGTRFVGKSTLVKSISENFGFSLAEIDGYELLNSGMGIPAVTVGIIKGKFDRLVESCENLVVFIKNIDAICKKGDEQQAEQKSIDDSLSLKIIQLMDEYTSRGVIFVTSSYQCDNINEIFRSKIKFEVDVGVPNEPERKEIFSYLVDFENCSSLSVSNRKGKYMYIAGSDVNIDTLALQSAALTPNDISYIVENVKLYAMNRMRKQSKELKIRIGDLVDFNGGVVKLTPHDFEESINKARNKFSDSIGAPRIPNVGWEDVGGLDVVKNEILDTIEMPLKHPELFGSGMKKRSGLLFYGPPGTGKTLLAKAIATNFSLNFFSVKGPELLNMYIGESEANVRRVFEKARDAKPCVIFFDELDSVAPRRGNQGDSGGVMDRIVSQLLAELDGMSGGDAGDGVFVVGASNRPDLLDEALLRPGRFDRMLYLGISDTHEKQAKIIQALTRKFNLDPEINLHEIAESCPFNFTGADFYALCSDAMLNAMIRTAGQVDKKLEDYNRDKPPESQLNTRQWFDKVATERDLDVVVCTQDFDLARRDLVASVSEEELRHYLRVRENFEGGKR